MKIGEARQIYSAQLQKYEDQKLSLAKKKKELVAKSNTVSNGETLISQEIAKLELSDQAISKKYEEYQKFMEQLTNLHSGIYNMEVSKQQGEAMSEGAKDLAKILEVARRIAEGGKVPPADEQKLMEYNMAMYLSAKNIAMMNERKKRVEYDSLWADEKGSGGNPDPNQVADNKELTINTPEVVDMPDEMEATVDGEISG